MKIDENVDRDNYTKRMFVCRILKPHTNIQQYQSTAGQFVADK